MTPHWHGSIDDIDLNDLDFWARPHDERHGAFDLLRAERPYAFFEEYDQGPIPAGRGVHAITRHADLVAASRQPELFCSGAGAVSVADLPVEFNEFFGSMINMDDPRHLRLRRIVARAFTPRVLGELMHHVERRAAAVVDAVAERGTCDFVTEIAAPFPLQIICDMLDIPESQHQFVLDRTNVILGGGDPEFVAEEPDAAIAQLLTAGAELSALMEEMGEARREKPGDDVVSALVNADIDGESLTRQELGSFFVLLVNAGNETTRTAAAHGLVALTDNPEQRRIWQDDFEAVAPTAIEEIVRYASPVTFMRRTATTDGARLGDHEFAEGDKLLLFYNAANRDPEVFTDPHRFDVMRSPNDHVGFGGPGPHFCLGAHLARRELTVLFRTLFDRIPDIHVSGEPQYLLSNFINGVKHLPAEFTAA